MAGQFLRRKAERAIVNARESIVKLSGAIRRAYYKKRIKSRDFTVISNNCWAGRLYQYLDMPYLSPTVGLYFFADDYIRFVTRLEHYMSLDLQFIALEESKYYNILKAKGELSVPIGVLEDVEIIFLHYHSVSEAREKWTRRKQRIRWDNLYIKFSKMNLCTEEHLRAFDALSYPRKFMFVPENRDSYGCAVLWKGPTDENGQILLDTIPFPGCVKISKIIK